MLPRQILCQDELFLYLNAIESGTTCPPPGLVTFIFVTGEVLKKLWLSMSDTLQLRLISGYAAAAHAAIPTNVRQAGGVAIFPSRPRWLLSFPPGHPSSSHMIFCTLLLRMQLKQQVSFYCFLFFFF